jgi:D-amino-acid dehydrogenase
MPGWADAAVREVWAGLRPCSPDGLPIIGRLPAAERVVVATGHAMLGLTLAPVTGRLVGELLGGRPRAEMAELSPGRF